MSLSQSASPFPAKLRFPDVDAATLAREDMGERRVDAPAEYTASASWEAYLTRLLEPIYAGVRVPRLVTRG